MSGSLEFPKDLIASSGFPTDLSGPQTLLKYTAADFHPTFSDPIRDTAQAHLSVKTYRAPVTKLRRQRIRLGQLDVFANFYLSQDSLKLKAPLFERDFVSIPDRHGKVNASFSYPEPDQVDKFYKFGAHTVNFKKEKPSLRQIPFVNPRRGWGSWETPENDPARKQEEHESPALTILRQREQIGNKESAELLDREMIKENYDGSEDWTTADTVDLKKFLEKNSSPSMWKAAMVAFGNGNASSSAAAVGGGAGGRAVTASSGQLAAVGLGFDPSALLKTRATPLVPLDHPRYKAIAELEEHQNPLPADSRKFSAVMVNWDQFFPKGSQLVSLRTKQQLENYPSTEGWLHLTKNKALTILQQALALGNASGGSAKGKGAGGDHSKSSFQDAKPPTPSTGSVLPLIAPDLSNLLKESAGAPVTTAQQPFSVIVPRLIDAGLKAIQRRVVDSGMDMSGLDVTGVDPDPFAFDPQTGGAKTTTQADLPRLRAACIEKFLVEPEKRLLAKEKQRFGEAMERDRNLYPRLRVFDEATKTSDPEEILKGLRVRHIHTGQEYRILGIDREKMVVEVGLPGEERSTLLDMSLSPVNSSFLAIPKAAAPPQHQGPASSSTSSFAATGAATVDYPQNPNKQVIANPCMVALQSLKNHAGLTSKMKDPVDIEPLAPDEIELEFEVGVQHGVQERADGFRGLTNKTASALQRKLGGVSADHALNRGGAESPPKGEEADAEEIQKLHEKASAFKSGGKMGTHGGGARGGKANGNVGASPFESLPLTRNGEKISRLDVVLKPEVDASFRKVADAFKEAGLVDFESGFL
mmetsp:Transcript_12353/g.29959  ORF Transcript_12353/g.29959 Transcript_12353/m.29959 type:complete len:812 (-) Transcript_12353:147-2582(-)|eukprot:CAMPEP_0178999114 /NCGR_PEP_ID=MMETSP0795-20121207/9874_1 /TAXON_ID=88552 /ORGANISM="Amoebophrya sp., Strain Ameob2" /LENGTH=811 /DNA_ID=CAMNT_0020691839 /DNA_START=43 /DNA_END=2478 /DNA_ORIENTATION=-